jgi:predicted dehydrogenase
MSKPIVTALTSFGMSGQVFHAPVVSAHHGFQLKYILERSKENSKEKYSASTIARSYDEILQDPTVELVIVNTPNYLHYAMTKEALLAGKNVIVEKPFTVYEKEAVELIKLANEKNLILSVYHNKRLEGEFKTVQKIINEKLLGNIEVFETRFDRYRPEIGTKKWKEELNPGAGLLYDLGPHMIDQVLVLFGIPLTVEADLQVQRQGGKVVDYFKITLQYKNMQAIVTAGMFAKGEVLKYFIKGDKGIYSKYGNDPQEEMLKQGHSPLMQGWGEEPKEQWGKIQSMSGEIQIIPTLPGTYMDFYTSIYDTIRNNIQPIIAAEEALLTIRIIELAYESHDLGLPVPLSGK